ncbi:hypothetical protein Ancab_020550 [Ancistrocladus abbreviatus]
MAKFAAALMCGVLLFGCMEAILAHTRYMVGDANGWTTNKNYNEWTKGKAFRVGDTLVFHYREGYSVDEVTAQDMEACECGNAVFTDRSGNTCYTIKKTGPHYFIGGAFHMCRAGMNMTINVCH